MERPQQNSTNALLLAPIHAVGETPDSIYEYIKKQHAIKNDYETSRLLYVAATRAKKYLHCFFNLQSSESGQVSKPLNKSLLEKLWLSIESETLKNLIYCNMSETESIKNHVHCNTNNTETIKNFVHYNTNNTETIKNFVHYNTNNTETIKNLVHSEIYATEPPEPTNQRMINRLTLDWQNPITELNPLEQITYHNKSSGFLLSNYTAKITGIIVHKVLEKISLSNPAWWNNKTTGGKERYLQSHLIQAGILMHEIESVSYSIINAINNTLNDERGQWIVHNHKESQSEFHLSAMIENKVNSFVIDRTFVDEHDVRWIIDFKTSTPNNETLESFLDKEQTKYSKQLQQYMLAIQQIDTRPIKIGLYFPFVPAWCECVRF